jgi:hypothetical protein
MKPLLGQLTSRWQALGSLTSLPATVSNHRIAARFGLHSSLGAVLLSVTNRSSPLPFTWRNDPAAVGADARLWELRGKNQIGATVTIAPSAATSFDAYSSTTPEGDPALVLVWSGVSDQNNGTLQVVVIASLPPNRSEVQFWPYVTRETAAAGVSIDEIDCPRTYWAPPVAARAGQTELESQKRTFSLVPNNALGTLITGTQCGPGYVFWAGGAHISGQPAINRFSLLGSQSMQFCAMAAMDPQDAASYRQVLHLGSRDREAKWQKSWRIQGLLTPSFTSSRLFWTCTHYPSFARRPLLDAEADTSEFGNVYYARFPSAVAVIHAQSDAWQFDAARYYREWAIESGLMGTPKQYRSGRCALHDGQPMMGVIQHAPIASGPTLFALFQKHLDEIKVAIDGPEFPVDRSAVLWQNWLQAGVGVKNPYRPIDGGAGNFRAYDDGFPEAMVAAAARGFMVAPYTEGTHFELGNTYLASAPDSTRGRARNGGVEDPITWRWDIGQPETVQFLAEDFYRDIAFHVRSAGFYMDGLAGGYGVLMYPQPGERGHFPHGGDWWLRGKRDLWQRVRSEIAKFSPFGPGGDGVVVLSEAVQEGISDLVDSTAEGYTPQPYSATLGMDSLWGFSVPDVPWAAKALTPPLWSYVYHRSDSALRLAVPLTSIGLSTSAQHPDGSYPGMAPDEWRDYLCYLYAGPWISGMQVMHQAFMDFDGQRLYPSSGGPVHPGDEDPEAIGPQVMNFIRDLQQSRAPNFLAPWIVYGDHDRPFDVDYDHAENETQNNPVNSARACTPAAAIACMPPFVEPYKPAHSDTLNATAFAGSQTLSMVVGNDWFGQDAVVINPSGPTEQTARITGFNRTLKTITINTPLETDHLAGETVARAETDLLPFNTWRFMSEPFRAPLVLHSVWRNLPGDRVGFVLCNWSGRGASWRGTFDPALYGFVNTVAVRELHAGGVKTDVALIPGPESGFALGFSFGFGGAGGRTKTVVRATGTPQIASGELLLGNVGQRSFRAFEFTDAPASGFSSGFSNGFGGPFAPLLETLAPSGFSAGFDRGFGVTPAAVSGFDDGFSSGFGQPADYLPVGFSSGFNAGFQ